MQDKLSENFNRLSDLKRGDTFEVKGFDEDTRDTRLIRAMGVYESASGKVTLCHKHKMVVTVGGTRIALDKQIAKHVIV